ncbi:MAG: prolipoprotein diacylglyceryl transferase [Candidatus Obscuribacterales bacterium]|nr:prolipoprotein diacylglyceryl transferase [Candidatus Obscuribacterales bacterium]
MPLLVLQSPGAVLFQLGSLTVRWYGVMIALGFVAATWFALRLAVKRQVNSETFVNFSLICFIGGIIGARLYFVALNWESYLRHPGEILATWLGGLSIHGGLIGGALCGYFYARSKKLPKLISADIIGCTIPLAQAIGRWGNFFNSEAFGHPVGSGAICAVKIPLAARPELYRGQELFQPTFLYESIWNLLLFALLYFGLAERLKNYPGLCFAIYLGGYSLGRLVIEPLRTDSIMYGGFPVPIVASLVLLLVSFILAFYFFARAKTHQESAQ